MYPISNSLEDHLRWVHLRWSTVTVYRGLWDFQALGTFSGQQTNSEPRLRSCSKSTVVRCNAIVEDNMFLTIAISSTKKQHQSQWPHLLSYVFFKSALLYLCFTVLIFSGIHCCCCCDIDKLITNFSTMGVISALSCWLFILIQGVRAQHGVGVRNAWQATVAAGSGGGGGIRDPGGRVSLFMRLCAVYSKPGHFREPAFQPFLCHLHSI